MSGFLKQTIIVVTAAVAGSLLYFYFDPSVNPFFPPCPFYTLTGLACPGCGSQRAFHDLLHGNIVQAMDHNVLFVWSVPLVSYSGIVATHNLLAKNTWDQPLFHSALFARMVLATVVVFWVLRNVPVYPFTWLAPAATS